MQKKYIIIAYVGALGWLLIVGFSYFYLVTRSPESSAPVDQVQIMNDAVNNLAPEGAITNNGDHNSQEPIVGSDAISAPPYSTDGLQQASEVYDDCEYAFTDLVTRDECRTSYNLSERTFYQFIKRLLKQVI